MNIRVTFSLLVILVVLFLGLTFQSNKKDDSLLSPATASSLKETTTVTIDNQRFEVEVARSLDDQRLGLSKRGSMPTDHGMLFVFSPSSQPAFWMKDMLFPLDIVWISNQTIIGIEHHLPIPNQGTQPQDLPTYQPKQAIDYVLELNAGVADHFIAGDHVEIIQTKAL